MANTPTHGYRSLRAGRRSIPGQRYLVTTVAWQRRALFRNPATASRVARVLSDPSVWNPGQCLCWVLMPDHWHGLLVLGQNQNLSTTMQQAKGRCSHDVGEYTRLPHPLWQQGFHDRALRRDESVIATARYIIANPLRAGLVENIRDYPYWDAVWLNQPDDLAGFDILH